MSQERRCDQRHVHQIILHQTESHKNQKDQLKYPEAKQIWRLSVCGKADLWFHSLGVIKQSVQHTQVSSDETFEARCRGRLIRGYRTMLKGPTVSFRQALQMETTVLAWEHSLKEFSVVGSQRTLHLPQLLSSPLQVVLRSLCVSSTLESSQRHSGEMGCHAGPVETHPWTPWPIPPRTQLCSLSSHITFLGP